MGCDEIREALSAQADGEEPGVTGHRVETHLRRCPACRAWRAALGALHGLVRVRPADAVPDLTARILAS